MHTGTEESNAFSTASFRHGSFVQNESSSGETARRLGATRRAQPACGATVMGLETATRALRRP